MRSKTLTCTSCHNTHVQERADLALLSRRCMNCHHSMKEDDRQDALTNLVHTHLIKTYPDRVKKIIDSLIP